MQTHLRQNLTENKANAASQPSKFQLEDNRPIQRKSNKTGLSGHLKSSVENLSGHDKDDVKVDDDSSKAVQLKQAWAWPASQGNQITLGRKNLSNIQFAKISRPVIQKNDTGYGASIHDMREYKDGNKSVGEIPAETLADFEAVHVLLNNHELVLKYLKKLDRGIAKDERKDVGPREKFDAMAQSIEKSSGYGKVQVLTLEAGIKDGAKAVRKFARDGQPFLDYGVSSVHGPDTHRIQQLIINLAYKGGKLKLHDEAGPVGIYKKLGDPKYGVYKTRIDGTPLLRRKSEEGEKSRTKIYAWELILDRFNGKNGVYLVDHETGKNVNMGPFDAGIPISLNLAITGSLSEEIPSLSAAVKEGIDEHKKMIKVANDNERAQEVAKNRARYINYATVAALGVALAAAGYWFWKKK